MSNLGEVGKRDPDGLAKVFPTTTRIDAVGSFAEGIVLVAAGGFGSIYRRTVTVSSYFINDNSKKKGSPTSDQMHAGSENCRGGCCDPLEPKVKVASQSVFYALRSRGGTCASGCGASQHHIAEIVFGIEIVEWDLCSTCLSRTGFLEYFNSLPSATPREAEEIKILLGISNETLERQNRVAAPIT